jgi:hypothetical protein
MVPAERRSLVKAEGYQPFAPGGKRKWEMGNGIVREALFALD